MASSHVTGAAPMQQGVYASAAAPATAQASPAATAGAMMSPHLRYQTHGAAAIAEELQVAGQTMARPALKPEAPTRPLAAPPAAESEGPFIAPRPVDPGLPPAQAAMPSAPSARPDPFAEAAYANAGGRAPAPRAEAKPAAPPAPRPAPVKEKPRSLFERVTGAAGLRRPAAPEPRHAEPRIEARPAAAAAPVPAQPAPAPTAAAPAAPASRPGLSQVDPGERLAASQPADDLLDIPAFLRRQAN
jgi:cell division protein FtsZ